MYSDPYGLAQFGTRPLDGTSFQVPIGNVGLLHENAFFEDGTDVGFFPEGIRADDPNQIQNYNLSGPFYEDGLLRQAEQNLRNSGLWLPDDPLETLWSPVPNDYDLIGRNCQNFSDALREEYGNLGGGTCEFPFVRGVCPFPTSPVP